MRTRFIKILCLFSVLTLLFSNSVIPLAQDYNDRRFSTYINMGDSAVKNNYQVPHMFRQDAPYTYMTKFPLVVSGGVEYVPLSMFILYSYIEVNYSGIDEDFYLVNNRNGNYISFNIKENIAYTHNGELMKMETRFFHKTRYIPARKVAEVLGMMCETYDDPFNGIYAFRISNGKSDKTLVDLLTPYLPKEEPKQDEPEKEPVPEKKPVEDKPVQPEKPVPEITPRPEKDPVPEKQPEPEKPEDPIEKLERRNLSLCFTGLSYNKADIIANTLRNYAVTCSFSVTKDEILQNPSLVRQLFLNGNSIFVTAEPDFEAVAQQNSLVTGEQLDLLYANAFVSELENANNALKLVLKNKTRICTLPYNMPQGENTYNVFMNTLKQAGYLVYIPDVDSGDYPDSNIGAYTVSAKIKNAVTAGHQSASFNVKALLNCSDKSYYYILDLAGFINKYEKLNFFKPTEYTLFTSHKEN